MGDVDADAGEGGAALCFKGAVMAFLQQVVTFEAELGYNILILELEKKN